LASKASGDEAAHPTLGQPSVTGRKETSEDGLVHPEALIQQAETDNFSIFRMEEVAAATVEGEAITEVTEYANTHGFEISFRQPGSHCLHSNPTRCQDSRLCSCGEKNFLGLDQASVALQALENMELATSGGIPR